MFEIPRQIYDRIIALLTPLMDTSDNRQGWVLPAFQGHSALLDQIKWEGNARSFTTQLIDLCLRYGEVELGKQALIMLLDSVRTRVGDDQQWEIDELRSLLGKPITRPDVEPYRGLAPFTDEDTQFFFGRDKMIATLVDKVRERNFVIVVGNSGSGKSSLVRAGLIAKLHKNIITDSADWEIALMRPHLDPLRELADLLIHRLDPELTPTRQLEVVRDYANQLLKAELTIQDDIAPALQKQLPSTPYFLLVVDQFEEIFDPRINDELRQGFIDTLRNAYETGWFKIVLILRSDFYEFLLKHIPLAELADQAQLNVLPMDTEERRAAIEQPALATGRRFEAGLVRRIIDDIEEAPGDLPLLQFALTQLWERQTPERVLTHGAYDAIGGVSGAIAQHAQNVYQQLDDRQKRQTQILFERRLVKIPEPEKALEHSTRRRINLDDLDETTQSLITNTLTAQGLLITDRDQATGERTVEIVHEALIQQWGELQSWLTQNQEDLRTHQALTGAVEIWERYNQKPALLYRGEQLRQAQAWATGHGDELLAKERDFLQSSQRWVWYRWGGTGTFSALIIFLVWLLLPGNPMNPIMIGPTPTPTISIPMPAGDFNIAIAPFEVSKLNLVDDELLASDLSNDAHGFAQKAFDYLKTREEQIELELGQTVNILGPDAEVLRNAVADDDIAQMATELRADILLYGILNPTRSQTWDIEPRYHIGVRATTERAGEIAGEYLLGAPIRYIPGNGISFNEARQEMQPRLDTLLIFVQGLDALDLGRHEGYEAAAQIFCDAAESQMSEQNNGTELLWLFCGHAQSILFWLGELEESDKGITAYRRALEVDPNQVRAKISLAALLIAIYKPLQFPFCDGGNYPELANAFALLQEIVPNRNTQTIVPDSTELGILLNMGHMYFWIGLCYEHLEGDWGYFEENWRFAFNNYDEVIQQQEIANARADLIDYSVAQAHIQRAVMYLYLVYINAQIAPESHYFPEEDDLSQKSVAHFEQAFTLLLIMQNSIEVATYTIDIAHWGLRAFCVDGRNDLAIKYLQEFSQEVPNWSQEEVLSKLGAQEREECGI